MVPQSLCSQVSYADKQNSHKPTGNDTANDGQSGNDVGKYLIAVQILTAAEIPLWQDVLDAVLGSGTMSLQAPWRSDIWWFAYRFLKC